MQKHILLLGSWKEIAKKVLKTGAKVSFFGNDVSLFDKEILNQFNHIETVDVSQTSTCLFLAKQLHAQQAIDAVITFSEVGMESAAIIGECLNIPSIELEALFLTKYKDEMRKRVDSDPELSIPWINIKNKEQLLAFMLEQEAIVVKPKLGGGSVDVNLILDFKQLEDLIAQEKALFQGNYMAEKFIHGTDMLSVETLSVAGKHNIIATSQLKLIPGTRAIFEYVLMPPLLAHSIIEETHTLVTNFLNKINIQNGVAHTEIKLLNNKPYLIESQTRVGGDRIWRMSEFTSGIDQIGNCLETLLGNPAEDLKPTANKANIFFIIVPPPGEVHSVSDISFIKELDYVQEFDFKVASGTIITEMLDNTNRYGTILICANNQEELLERVNYILSQIRITYTNETIWIPTFNQGK